jgi:hypothetical protein
MIPAMKYLKSIAANGSKFCALPRSERGTLLAALVGLPLLGFALRVLGLRRLQACLKCRARPIDGPLSRDGIARIAALINIAALHAPFASTCLTRSLLLASMLQRRGVTSQLRIGVRLKQGALDAHAWIEHEGVPINEPPNVGEQFAPFAEIQPLPAFKSP